MMGSYILHGKTPVPEDRLIPWAEWIENNNRHVAATRIGNLWVSTVFLGLDHNFDYSRVHNPILFELMVFQSGESHREYPVDLEQRRYTTWWNALRGHKRMVRRIRKEVFGSPKTIPLTQELATTNHIN